MSSTSKTMLVICWSANRSRGGLAGEALEPALGVLDRADDPERGEQVERLAEQPPVERLGARACPGRRAGSGCRARRRGRRAPRRGAGSGRAASPCRRRRRRRGRSRRRASRPGRPRPCRRAARSMRRQQAGRRTRRPSPPPGGPGRSRPCRPCCRRRRRGPGCRPAAGTSPARRRGLLAAPPQVAEQLVERRSDPFRLVVGGQHDRQGAGIHARQCTCHGPDGRGTLGPVSGRIRGHHPTRASDRRSFDQHALFGLPGLVVRGLRPPAVRPPRRRGGLAGRRRHPGRAVRGRLAREPQRDPARARLARLPGRFRPPAGHRDAVRRRSSWPAPSPPSTSTSSTRRTRSSSSPRSRSCPSRSTTSCGSPSRSRSSATCSAACPGGPGRSSPCCRRRTRSSTRSSTATARCS